MDYTIHSDGGARGNPGPSGIGALITDAQGNTLAEVCDYLGEQTNNFAEYEAVIRALETLRNQLDDAARTRARVHVHMDSELIVKQARGEYKVKHPVLRAQRERLAALENAFATVTFTHVPREQNRDADRLANRAMDRGA